jgi:Na+-transporting methylmalonyl-CoA/oxaloacetate decarboxylase gamma subunit
MRTYLTYLVSGALALLAFGATMLVQGGWRAALAAFAVLAGAGSVLSMISLLATGERLASPAPRRAIAQPAPAPKTRRAAAPEPVTSREPARPGPRPRPRLSSNPS